MKTQRPQNGFKNDGQFWLYHCGSWFAFTERAHFEEHKDGGFFADEHGAQIYSVVQSKHPSGEH